MMVQLSGPSFAYGDNMSVIHTTQRPESMLCKKSNSICYHAIRESVAMGEMLTGHVSTHHNPADIATKVLSGGRKRDYLCGLVIHDLTDHWFGWLLIRLIVSIWLFPIPLISSWVSKVLEGSLAMGQNMYRMTWQYNFWGKSILMQMRSKSHLMG